jgi:hypothetical protein
MADAIAGASVYDEEFCRRTEAAMRDYALATTMLTNAILAPPPPHVVGVFIAAAQSRALADSFVDGFNSPPEQLARLATPEAAAAYVSSFGMTLPDLG